MSRAVAGIGTGKKNHRSILHSSFAARGLHACPLHRRFCERIDRLELAFAYAAIFLMTSTIWIFVRRAVLELSHQFHGNLLDLRVHCVHMPVLQHLLGDQLEAQLERHRLVGPQDGRVEGL